MKHFTDPHSWIRCWSCCCFVRHGTLANCFRSSFQKPADRGALKHRHGKSNRARGFSLPIVDSGSRDISMHLWAPVKRPSERRSATIFSKRQRGWRHYTAKRPFERVYAFEKHMGCICAPLRVRDEGEPIAVANMVRSDTRCVEMWTALLIYTLSRHFRTCPLLLFLHDQSRRYRKIHLRCFSIHHAMHVAMAKRTVLIRIGIC